MKNSDMTIRLLHLFAATRGWHERNDDPGDARSQGTVWLFVFLALIFSGGSCGATWASGVQFRHLTPEDGLPHNFVLDILQDKRGFVWIASAAGLSRYDGRSFTTYTTERNNPDSLSSNYVNALAEDQDGNLWVGTKSLGLNLFNRETGKFHRYLHEANNPSSLSGNSISNKGLLLDSTGTLWIGTEKAGLNRLNRQTGLFTVYKHDPDNTNTLDSDTILAIHRNSSVNTEPMLWIGTDKGLNQFYPDNGKTIRHTLAALAANHDQGIKIQAIWSHSSDLLWLGSNLGLVLYEPTTGKLNLYQHDPGDPRSLSDNNITDIQPASPGQLWLATLGGGLDLFDMAKNQFIHHRFDNGNDRTLGNDTLSSLMLDTTGTLWIGTHGSGLDRMDPQLQKFTVYRHADTNPDSLTHNLVLDVFIDPEGGVWVATAGGLDRFNPASETFQHFALSSDGGNSHKNHFVHNVFMDRHGDVWAGTWGAGIFRSHFRDGDSNGNKPGHFTPFSLPGMRVERNFCFFEDSHGNLWIGTGENGVYKLNPERDQFRHYTWSQQHANSLSDPLVHRVIEDKRGTIWIATLEGLNRYRPDTDDFERYLHTVQDAHSLSDNSVKNILEDKSGMFWLTTDNGLNRFNPLTGSFNAYFVEDGLPHNRVDSIVQDDKGTLWIGTPKGMSRFDPSREQFTHFDYRDGLQGNVFNLVAVKDSQGRLYFSGTKGLQRFHPDAVTKNPHVPPVVLTALQLQDHAIAISDRPVVLAYPNPIFSISFAALNYTIPEKNRYAIKLEGFDSDWTETSQDSLRYTNMTPGHYTLRVKGSNNDGVWNEKGTEIQIVIQAPWWQTGWFKALMVVSLLGLFQGIGKWRMTAVQARNRDLEAKIAERTRDLNAAKLQADVHGYQQ